MNFFKIFLSKNSPSVTSNQDGFTLVELLAVIGTIGILAVMGMLSFSEYKKDAEYARAELTLRAAITALTLAELEVPDTFTLASTLSPYDGSPLTGSMATMFPGLTLPSQVRIGATWNACPTVTQKIVIAIPCRGDRYTYYVQDCDGSGQMVRDREDITETYIPCS